jgi:hypothetical protein
MIVCHSPSGTWPINLTPRGARPAEPHHVGADRSLVDKDQPGRIKHALLSYPTSPRASHVCSLSLFGLQAFFEGDVVSAKKTRKAHSCWFESLA